MNIFTKFSRFMLVFCLASCATKNNYEKLYQHNPAIYSYISSSINSSYISNEHYADLYMVPASCQKTVTAILAYEALGVDFRYLTKLYIAKKNGKKEQAVVSFSGDPTLRSEDLLDLLKPISNNKFLRKIIIDKSLFNTSAYSPNMMLYDRGTSYGIPASSVNIDGNIGDIIVEPTKLGKLATVSTDLNSDYIDSKISTTNDKTSIQIHWDQTRIKARGNINFSDAPIAFSRAPYDHEGFVISKIKNILKKLGLKKDIEIVIVSDKSLLPKEMILTNQIYSKTLKEIIPPALKKSDNLVFDALYLTMLHKYAEKEVADWSEGNNVIKLLIKKHLKIDPADAVFVDGSGLSRHNNIQPKILFTVLKQAYKNKTFVDSMPSYNSYSSLVKNDDLSNTENIKAKPGRMTGVACLCGYNMQKTNEPKAFVFIANNFGGSTANFVDSTKEFVKYNILK